MSEGVEYILSVDPGAKAGWCLHERCGTGEWRAIRAGSVNGTHVAEIDARMCLQIFDRVPSQRTVIVIEDQLAHGKRERMNAKSLRTLMYRASIWRVLAHLRAVTRCILVNPNTWQTWAGVNPRAKHAERMALVRGLARTALAVESKPGVEVTDDTACAVVIGMWASRGLDLQHLKLEE